MKITCSDKKKVIYNNNVDSMFRVYIIENVEMAGEILENVHNTFFQLKSGI